MSTPTEEVTREKEEESADLKSTIQEVSDHLKEFKYDSWISKLRRLGKLVYSFAEWYFPSSEQEKISDVEHHVDLCIKVLESVPQENRKSNHERAMFELLKGIFLNATPQVCEEAEHHILKSIQLNPCERIAWLCLYCCVAKKKDIDKAKKCYQTIFKLGGENSIVLDRFADLEHLFSRAHYIEESIKYAQRALVLNSKDDICSYVLGNAYFDYFRLTGGWNHSKLQLALKAYENCKKNAAEKSHPYIEYELSMVNRFLENYKMSLNGFSYAALMNPSCDALHQRKVTLQLLDNIIEGLLQGKPNEKNKRKRKRKSIRVDTQKLLRAATVGPVCNRRTIDLLTEGLNKNILVIASVESLVKYEYQTPVYYMLCDRQMNSFILTVFGIQKEAIEPGDVVTLLDPICKFVYFEWEGKHYEFKSVQVNLPEQVCVNGNRLPPTFTIRDQRM